MGFIDCCEGAKIYVSIVARILISKYKSINKKIEIHRCSKNWNCLVVELPFTSVPFSSQFYLISEINLIYATILKFIRGYNRVFNLYKYFSKVLSYYLIKYIYGELVSYLNSVKGW